METAPAWRRKVGGCFINIPSIIAAGSGMGPRLYIEQKIDECMEQRNEGVFSLRLCLKEALSLRLRVCLSIVTVMGIFNRVWLVWRYWWEEGEEYKANNWQHPTSTAQIYIYIFCSKTTSTVVEKWRKSDTDVRKWGMLLVMKSPYDTGDDVKMSILFFEILFEAEQPGTG